MKRYKRLYLLLGVLAVACIATFGVLRFEEHQEQIKNSDEIILKVPSDTVTSLSWEYQEESLSFHKEEVWLYDEDEAFPVSEEKINGLLAQFEEFGASFIIENVQDYGQYGLDVPVCTIRFSTDEQEYEVQLGDYSSMDSERYVSIGSGILMADPRIVDHPRSIERATYSELRQLSYSGAQVLHEMTIFPVREKNIPLNIRNTNEPDHPGTLITESFVEAPNPERFVTGIAGKCDFSIVTVSKKGLSGAVGTLRAILEVFENNSIPVAHTPSGIDCISLAMPTEALTPNQYSLLDELRSEIRPDSIQINDHIAVIAVVGRKMAFRVGTSGKIFAALGKAGINIRMISQGPDEQAIILGVDNKDYADAIRVLYNAFVK